MQTPLLLLALHTQSQRDTRAALGETQVVQMTDMNSEHGREKLQREVSRYFTQVNKNIAFSYMNVQKLLFLLKNQYHAHLIYVLGIGLTSPPYHKCLIYS